MLMQLGVEVELKGRIARDDLETDACRMWCGAGRRSGNDCGKICWVCRGKVSAADERDASNRRRNGG